MTPPCKFRLSLDIWVLPVPLFRLITSISPWMTFSEPLCGSWWHSHHNRSPRTLFPSHESFSFLPICIFCPLPSISFLVSSLENLKSCGCRHLPAVATAWFTSPLRLFDSREQNKQGPLITGRRGSSCDSLGYIRRIVHLPNNDLWVGNKKDQKNEAAPE